MRAGDTPEGAAVLVYVLGREPSPTTSRRSTAPVVRGCRSSPSPGRDDLAIPNVLASDVVRVRPGEGFPLEEIARTIASRPR